MLLVEDDAMSRELWTMLLESEGHAVAAAESGEQAVQLMQTARQGEMEAPDVVLADLQMPGLAGAALAAALRGVGRQRSNGQERTLLLAMSASEPRRTALKGFDGFLLKPFTTAALGQAISGAGLRVENGVASLEPQVGKNGGNGGHGGNGGNGGAEAKVLDEAVWERLGAAMPEVKLRELYTLCISDTRARIARMRKAAEEQHEEVFRRSAHEIKGACGMIGAAELRSLATAMEESGLEHGTLEVAASLNRFLTACERLEGMLGKRWVAS
jgi:CheY-like chemotaxis protein